jgi:hypothetical protein
MNNTPKERTQAADDDTIFSQELVMAIATHIPLLLIGPLLAALAAYAIAATAPIEYMSSSLLRIDRATARSIEAFATSPAIADDVLSKYDGTGNSPESRAAFVSQHLRLVDPDPGTERPGDRLYRLDVTHSDRRTAQSIASDFIQAWLESTKPRASARAYLEAEFERNKLTAAANSKVIERLENIGLSSLTAAQISALIDTRDQNLAAANSLSDQLNGVSSNVIITPPHLPEDPVPTRARAKAVLVGVAATPVFLALILLGRYFAPGLSAYQVLSRRRRRAG